MLVGSFGQNPYKKDLYPKIYRWKMVPFLSKWSILWGSIFFLGGVSESRHLFFGVPPKKRPMESSGPLWKLHRATCHCRLHRCRGALIRRGPPTLIRRANCLNCPLRWWGALSSMNRVIIDDEWSHCHFTRILIPFFIDFTSNRNIYIYIYRHKEVSLPAC